MADTWLSDTRASYDTDASGYADRVRGLLDGKPYLRASLALFAESVKAAGGGPVADVGCGPGYVTEHLRDAGVDAFGIDLSPEMIALARRTYPRARFDVGTMTDLDLADGSLAGCSRSGRSSTFPTTRCPACSASSAA
ncbi:SAM-dependent methyltransferase [Prauserella isguenensis]|uniref:SAM-dependent methyltransferase n=1 Tax=Prauserella isguenensis TaxID=1470180 RepID=A0A839S4P8_9PSEU|nr:SAM-dependent methyltransferase [Prauserella isguenensis]